MGWRTHAYSQRSLNDGGSYDCWAGVPARLPQPEEIQVIDHEGRAHRDQPPAA